MEEIKAKLIAKYEMRDLGELHWFLNVKILRDRGQRKLWLSQSAYIDKIVASYKPPSRAVHTPLSIQSSQLVKYDGQATTQEIHAYQCRVGSTIYPSIITRPDIAHSASILSNLLQNPSPIHREQVENVI